MAITKCNGITIYYGDAADRFPSNAAAVYKEFDGHQLMQQAPCTRLQQQTNIEQVVFLQQVHGTQGYLLGRSEEIPPSFFLPGDFLITHMLRVGIGIITADCLPLVLVDAQIKLLGIAHVGWRGALAGIAFALLNTMQKAGAQVEHIHAFFGPSAGGCCYEVSNDWVEQAVCDRERDNNKMSSNNKDLCVSRYNTLVEQAIEKRNGKIYFNLPQFCVLQLAIAGIMPERIERDYNHCTICNQAYCSYRRDGNNAGRHITVAYVES